MLHMLEDIVIVTTRWSVQAMRLLYQVIRTVLKSARLPLKLSKSCSFDHIEKEEITFIGFKWNLKTSLVSLKSQKVQSITQ